MASSAPPSEHVRTRTQQSPLASQRAKEAGGHPSETQSRGRFQGLFPLGYKEGFSQWWAGLTPQKTEHAVLSFIPHLQKPPTHTETGSAPVTASPSTEDFSSEAERTLSPVTTTSLNDPYGPRRWHSDLVQLSGKNRALNEFSVERVGEEVKHNLVMLHGYGAGLGFFYKNFEGLSRIPGWKVYALDLLGMGRSSRPPFRIHAKDRQGKITEAENWFVDALEEWRIKKGIDRFTLLGHSLGGYMAVAYALKYPGHLNKLILASPVGIPEDPYAVNADMPEPEDSTMANEFTQDQGNTTSGTNPDVPPAAKIPQGDNNNFLNARKNAEQDPADNSGKPPRKPLPKWLTYLWDANISPFSFVRWSGPLGPRLVSGWTSRRFSHLPADEAQALHNYSYSLFRQRGSGEYALAYILAPGAFARSPLIRRIQGVGRQWIGPHEGPIPDSDVSDSASEKKKCSFSTNSSVTTAEAEASSTSDASVSGAQHQPSLASTLPNRRRETGIPILFMYGENDWMDIAGGFAAEQKILDTKRETLKNATEEERRRDSGSAKVVVIQKAGHHVYLDGSEQFNEVMREEMEDVVRRERDRRIWEARDNVKV